MVIGFGLEGFSNWSQVSRYHSRLEGLEALTLYFKPPSPQNREILVTAIMVIPFQASNT